MIKKVKKLKKQYSNIVTLLIKDNFIVRTCNLETKTRDGFRGILEVLNFMKNVKLPFKVKNSTNFSKKI